MLVEVFDDKGALLEKDGTLVIKEKLMQLVQEGKRIRRENKKQRIYGNNLGKNDDGDNEEPNDDDDIDDQPQHLFIKGLYSSKCLRDTEDMVELVRNCPTEFKEYYIQMQAAKRSQAPLPSQQESINWDTIVRMRRS
ncbi:hypothetical protein Q3G72_016151 [Acer saccharum]|nr:hypothetical protein Q3G72_016151 [Acer saccharum]